MTDGFGWGNVPDGWWPIKGHPKYMMNAALEVRVIESGHKMIVHKDKTKKGTKQLYVRLWTTQGAVIAYIWDLGVDSVPPF